MNIYQSRTFENRVNKLSKQEKEILDEEIKKIAESPLIGEEKKGTSEGCMCISSESSLSSISFPTE